MNAHSPALLKTLQWFRPSELNPGLVTALHLPVLLLASSIKLGVHSQQFLGTWNPPSNLSLQGCHRVPSSSWNAVTRTGTNSSSTTPAIHSLPPDVLLRCLLSLCVLLAMASSSHSWLVIYSLCFSRWSLTAIETFENLDHLALSSKYLAPFSPHR